MERSVDRPSNKKGRVTHAYIPRDGRRTYVLNFVRMSVFYTHACKCALASVCVEQYTGYKTLTTTKKDLVHKAIGKTRNPEFPIRKSQRVRWRNTHRAHNSDISTNLRILLVWRRRGWENGGFYCDRPKCNVERFHFECVGLARQPRSRMAFYRHMQKTSFSLVVLAI